MISCGEASGDMYAGRPRCGTAAPRSLVPNQRVRRRAAACGGRGAHGRLPRIRRDRPHRGDSRVAAVVSACTGGSCRMLALSARTFSSPIDFPDFNFRLGAAVHALGIPVVYYVSPQLWAWRSGRIHAMKRFVAMVLPIFPFEVDIYQREGIPVEFVGHPLVDLIDVQSSRDEFLRGAGPRSGGTDGRAAAREPPERAARDSSGARRGDAAHRRAGEGRAVRGGACAPPAGCAAPPAPASGHRGLSRLRSSTAIPTTCCTRPTP